MIIFGSSSPARGWDPIGGLCRSRPGPGPLSLFVVDVAAVGIALTNVDRGGERAYNRRPPWPAGPSCGRPDRGYSRPRCSVDTTPAPCRTRQWPCPDRPPSARPALLEMRFCLGLAASNISSSDRPLWRAGFLFRPTPVLVGVGRSRIEPEQFLVVGQGPVESVFAA